MENKKTLKINCALCNARNITEEFLASYEQVRINCAHLITNTAAQLLLGKYASKINTATTTSVEEEVRVSVANGSLEIAPGQKVPQQKTILVVNGTLDIAPGSEDILNSYAHITVNGSVSCPKSMVSLLSMMSINGCTDAYPDGCIRLKDTAVLDRTFRLRAKQDALYYASSQLVAVAPDIDFAALAAKNVRFETRELIVCESQAEAAVALVDERAEITIVPDGCAYVGDSLELDEGDVKRYGTKMYVNGDVTIMKENAPCLDQIEFLQVDGTVRTVRSLRDRVLAMNIKCEDMETCAGEFYCDKKRLTVTANMLEQAEDGVEIADCLYVAFQEDVSPELIRAKLMRLADCPYVICTEAQQAALERIAEGVAHMGPDADKDEQPDDDGSVVKINCATYTF